MLAATTCTEHDHVVLLYTCMRVQNIRHYSGPGAEGHTVMVTL